MLDAVGPAWTESVDAHRAGMRDAVLDAAAALVAEQGFTAVTMSRLAGRAGIGRATLYKYFPDVGAVVSAWHAREVARHLDHLAAVAVGHDDAGRRLDAVLDAYARLRHASAGPGGDTAALLHRGEHVDRARQQLHDLVRGLVSDAVAAGGVRGDVPADELATYCLHALGGAAGPMSAPAVDRLVRVTLDGLRRRG